MEFNIYRLRGVERELKRLNENFELLLKHAYDINPVQKKKRDEVVLEDTAVIYTNEEEDARREILEAVGKMPKD